MGTDQDQKGHLSVSGYVRDWVIRNPKEEDIPFIYATWIASMRGDSRLGKGCKPRIFNQGQTAVVDCILENLDTHILIACKPDDPHIIFGYAVFTHSMKAVHYVYVKEAFRKYGIATSLMNERPSVEQYTHKTFTVKPILKKYPKLTYNPFLLFIGDQHGREES